jgi:two-component system response regulator FixJ
MTESKVFVVEDDAAVRDSLQFLLESSGLVVESYPSGEAFLEHCRVAEEGCVLADLRMPGMDGLDLARRIAERGSSLCMVLVTAHVDTATRVRAQQAGVLAVLEKPLDDVALLAAVRKAMALHCHPPPRRENRR